MRFCRITLVELLAIIAIVGILAALLGPAVGRPLTDADLNLDDWKPGAEHLAVPPDAIRVRDLDLAGAWTDGIGWLDFDMKLLPDGRYGISFLSHSRCGLGGSVRLERFAEYDDGVLILDRPVRELRGIAYSKLYSIRADETIYLLPSPRVTEVGDALEIPHRGVLAQVTQ